MHAVGHRLHESGSGRARDVEGRRERGRGGEKAQRMHSWPRAVSGETETSRPRSSAVTSKKTARSLTVGEHAPGGRRSTSPRLPTDASPSAPNAGIRTAAAVSVSLHLSPSEAQCMMNAEIGDMSRRTVGTTTCSSWISSATERDEARYERNAANSAFHGPEPPPPLPHTTVKGCHIRLCGAREKLGEFRHIPHPPPVDTLKLIEVR